MKKITAKELYEAIHRQGFKVVISEQPQMVCICHTSEPLLYAEKEIQEEDLE